ncbi:BTAD domain-containing putative transcriptional regulator [Streptomyces lasalocidi]|uniref:BTAD domain-containing putative transcriptional regulator n=1 Tax=Streptomyces lasalocidi TaxID=324833 RepID=UPI0019D5488C|nr:BTAD domain-containing putative transcriptional regulator [Streptomyces lasalocidi]
MQFRVLGPLEVLDQGRPVVLRGTKQRATLGFLLLQPNRVVPVSQLLNALWGVDEAPTTARKILQNAVYGIRGLLSPRADSVQPDTYAQTGPTLLTQPAGYMMRVIPEHVDVHLFHRRVAQGREQRAQGAPERAAGLLREALGLWRGPALADLVEAGIDWPELAALEKTRLDVLEDYFDAQLACARHYEVLPELETMVQAEPLRERSCGQLMLALYRCGRQVDALNAYSRLRAQLVENLGLEPARELQALQQAILAQDISLSPGVGGPLPDRTGDAPVRDGGAYGIVRTEATVTAPAPPPPDDGPAPARFTDGARRRVAILSVSTRLVPAPDGGAQEDVDDLLAGTTLMVREQIERFGGKVTASIGSVSLALFGLQDPAEEDVSRAVLAALAVRDILVVADEAGRLTARAAVTVGDVLLRHGESDDAPAVVGAALDESHALLTEVSGDEVWVRDEVRRATASTISYSKVEDAPRLWRVTGRRESAPGQGVGARQTCELDVLSGLVRRTWLRSVPHLVTVLGEEASGRNQLLEDFRGWSARQSDSVLFLTGRTPSAPDDDPLQAQAEILAAYCGLRPAQDGTAVLERETRYLFTSERTADWIVSRLAPLVSSTARPGDAYRGDDRLADTLHAWRTFFQQVARRRPVVLAVDDLHRASDQVLETVEACAGSTGPCRLFVVAAAGPELLLRRPSWGGGKHHATTVTLDPPERVSTGPWGEVIGCGN